MAAFSSFHLGIDNTSDALWQAPDHNTDEDFDYTFVCTEVVR